MIVDREKTRERESNIIVAFAVLVVASVFVVPYVIVEWFVVWDGWSVFLVIWYASLILFAGLIILLLMPFFVSSEISGGNHGSSLFGLFLSVSELSAYGYVLYCVYPLLTSADVTWYILVLVSSIVMAFVYVLGALLIAVTTLGLSKLFSARIMARAPHSLFVDKVLAVLEISTSKNEPWNDIGVKNELMRNIEEAARVISERFPRAIKTQDPDTDAWLAKRCNQIAANLRAKKTWICMPKSDTKMLLEENLSRLLVAALFGTWDELETSPVIKPLRPSIKAIIRIFISDMFIALFPAAVYFSAQKLGLLESRALQEYFGFGVVLWAVLAILPTIDPRFGDKIGAFEKIAAGIPGLLKKSDREK